MSRDRGPRGPNPRRRRDACGSVRDVTSSLAADRIPVTGLTPAAPDPRWHPKAYEGEVVPFRATVFREGHDLVGALLVATAPSGARHVRLNNRAQLVSRSSATLFAFRFEGVELGCGEIGGYFLRCRMEHGDLGIPHRGEHASHLQS